MTSGVTGTPGMLSRLTKPAELVRAELGKKVDA
jgi:hypothetical protein